MSPTLKLVVENPEVLRGTAVGTFHPKLVPDTGEAVPAGKHVHCLDCATCSGICAAYLEAANIPDTILARKRRRV